MNTVELIRKKREGLPLTEEELRFLIDGYTNDRVPDYQMSAFLMACYFRGLTNEETLSLTRVMLHSGETLDLSDIPGAKVDKHSTGGVGDKTSIILAPIVASHGVPVPMISGRGLGHTGGTLDKLEAIPGFRTNLSVSEYREVIRKTGLVMAGQTGQIAPADKKMYALRDVTATIECIPLIASSIMSKKLAEGIDGLVLDVKTGRAAFTPAIDQARELTRMMVKLGEQFGKETVAFITNMEQPLGVAVGNWLEIVESVECLRGTRGIQDSSSDLMELTHVLAGAMLLLGRKVSTVQEGVEFSRQAISDGSAYRKFLELVNAQGGDVSTIENLERFPLSKHALEVKAATAGYVDAVDALEIGYASMMLGSGRSRIEDRIDPKAGILLKKKTGDHVEVGETLATLYTDLDDSLNTVRERVSNSFSIVPEKKSSTPLILEMIDNALLRK